MMGKRKTTKEFVSEAHMMHGDTYDYSLVEYGGWNVGVKIVCRKHGEFIQKPNIHLDGKGCPECGTERTMVAVGQEQGIVKTYGDGLSCRKIADRIGISDVTVINILQRAGVNRRSLRDAHVKYQANHSYFSKIDSGEKAYWLGWMASDGYVACGKYTRAIGLCLQERDREIIDAFRTTIGSEHPVRTFTLKSGRSYSELRIVSPQMVDDLGRLGIVPNKSKKLKCPNVPLEFQWDFFRGMFDGDGCVMKKSISLCGTKDIVEAFAKLCRKNGYGSQVYKHSCGTSTWYMRSCGRNARGILGMLYGSGIGLSRKRNKAIAWIGMFSGKDGLNRAA